jgi:hypothetical protein
VSDIILNETDQHLLLDLVQSTPHTDSNANLQIQLGSNFSAIKHGINFYDNQLLSNCPCLFQKPEYFDLVLSVYQYMQSTRGPILICGLTIALLLFSLFDAHGISASTFHDLDQIKLSSNYFNQLFSVFLLSLLLLCYIKRRKRTRLILSLFLGLVSYICWFSTDGLWANYSIGIHAQRFIALIILGFGFWILVSKSIKDKRKAFSAIVRREVIQKQKGKCAACKRKLTAYGLDLDHKNGDRSNNKPSNCQVLCVPCHRRKHAKQ